MSKKLEKALASGKVVVKNCASGEVKLTIQGNDYTIANGSTLDLTSIVPNLQDIVNIPGLAQQIKIGNLQLV